MRTIQLAWMLGLAAGCTDGDGTEDKSGTDDTDPVEETDAETDPPGDTDPTDTDPGDTDTDPGDTDEEIVEIDYLESPIPGEWGEGFVMPGFVGASASRVVDVVRLPDGRLVAGGIFEFVTSDPVEGLAVYDEATNSWGPLDGNPQPGFNVEDLLVLSDGRLVVVGWSSGFIGIAGQVRILDGGIWTDPTPGINGRVYTAYESDDGTLMFGGDFSFVGGLESPGLVAFDGVDFVAIDAFVGSSATVHSIFPRDGYEACISGLFGPVGGVDASNVACFDGTVWSAWGEHDSSVYGVTQLSDDTWISWGTFGFGEPATNSYSVGLGVWDGVEWAAPAELGIDGGMVAAVRDVLPVDDGGYYIAGEFDGVGGYWGAGNSTPASNVAFFDGTAWWPVGTGIRMTTGIVAANVPGGYTLHEDDDGTVWIGGLFQEADGLTGSGLASWDGSAMSVPFDTSVKPGIDGSGLYVEVASDGTVWVVVESAANGYTPTLLQMLPDGTLDNLHNGPSGRVTGMVLDQGDLYVSGQLGGIGRQDCDVARYRLGQWSCVVRDVGGAVEELATDGQGRFVVAGVFDGPGGSQNIAWYDGTELLGLGEGFVGDVNEVEISPDGTIYIFGYEDPADPSDLATQMLAQWDGTEWEMLGDWESGSVHDLEWYDGKLLISGSYMRRLPVVPDEQGEIIGQLVAWDGTSLEAWGEIEGGWGTNLLYAWGGGLFLEGSFDTAGGVDVGGGLAWFDGTTWHALGEGTDDLINDIAVGDDAFWFVGPFHNAGGEPSFGIARWEVTTP